MLAEKSGKARPGSRPPSGPLIRRARPEDVPALGRLIEKSVLGLQARDYAGAVLDSALRNGLLALDGRLIPDGTYYVAELGGRIVGAGGWSRRRNIVNGAAGPEEGDDLLDPATEAAKIRAFYTLPDHARQGIGSALLRACEEAARRSGFRRLELISTLTGTPLYAAHGWEEHERLEIPLPDGRTYPGIRMAKRVGPRPDPGTRHEAATETTG